MAVLAELGTTDPIERAAPKRLERANGHTVEGGEPSEVTELWTFMRARGGNWLLSAIQQT